MPSAPKKKPVAASAGQMLAVTDVIRISRAFSVLECEEIIALREGLGRRGDRFLNYGEIRGASEVCWLETDMAPQWLRERVLELMQDAVRTFDFDISEPLEAFKLIKYRHGNRVQWHVDCGGGHTDTRKLTLTVLLSPADSFDGGALTLATNDRSLHRDVGDVVIFPSFLAHKVTTVTRGVRHTLVTWAHGPRFR